MEDIGYDLELDKVVKKIKDSKAKLVLLQFPDGLKKHATSVVDYLEGKTSAEFLIWLGSCFGACDTPSGCENLLQGTPDVEGVDLTIQFGHNEMMPGMIK